MLVKESIRTSILVFIQWVTARAPFPANRSGTNRAQVVRRFGVFYRKRAATASFLVKSVSDDEYVGSLLPSLFYRNRPAAAIFRTQTGFQIRYAIIARI